MKSNFNNISWKRENWQLSGNIWVVFLCNFWVDFWLNQIETKSHCFASLFYLWEWETKRPITKPSHISTSLQTSNKQLSNFCSHTYPRKYTINSTFLPLNRETISHVSHFPNVDLLCESFVFLSIVGRLHNYAQSWSWCYYSVFRGLLCPDRPLLSSWRRSKGLYCYCGTYERF